MTDFLFEFHRIPRGWFLHGCGECVKPIHYRHDAHENTGEGFWCELQHREGGKLTRATGDTIDEAMGNAVDKVCRDWPNDVP